MHAKLLQPRTMREVGGKDYFEALMAAFDKYKNEHNRRLWTGPTTCAFTGLHETQSIRTSSTTVSPNRGASVRRPAQLP